MNKKIKSICLLASLALSGIAPIFAQDRSTDRENVFNKLDRLAFEARTREWVHPSKTCPGLLTSSCLGLTAGDYATDVVALSLNSIKEILTGSFSQRTSTDLDYVVPVLMDYISEFYRLSSFVDFSSFNDSTNINNLRDLRLLLKELAVKTRTILENDLEKACKPLIQTGDENDYYQYPQEFSSYEDYRDNMSHWLIREQLGSQIERILSLIDDIFKNKKSLYY